jgi:transposase
LVQGNKNDFNDGLAIVEALGRPRIHFVEIKTVEQQDMQALYRMRQRCLKERTALCNQARGLLAEYGIVLPKGISSIRSKLPILLEDAENGLSVLFRRLLAHSYQQLKEVDAHIDTYTLELKALSQHDEACQRLQTIPGYGPIVASVFRSVVGNGATFKRGRDVSASLGLVPKQHSSGGKNVLRGISKRGDCYLRGLLIHGARAVMNKSARKQDPLSRWVNRIKAERGVNRAVVALANKMARMGWAVLNTGAVYKPA